MIYSKHKNGVIALIALLIVVMSMIITAFTTVTNVKANEDIGVKETYEKLNVSKELQSSTIGGKPFNINDYPFDERGKIQIISFNELCYSCYEDKRNDFGLYIIIYNPTQNKIDDVVRNKIQLALNKNDHFTKYSLQFLSASNDAGSEGRFIKYKIKLSLSEQEKIFNTFGAKARTYIVSGYELSIGGVINDYAVKDLDGNTMPVTYTYTGYAKGYGSEYATSDTLTCVTDYFNKTLTLDVRSTWWRPDGTLSDLHSKDTLHSVYFSVPNDIVKEFGEMSAVHATWLNALTKPIFVTGNKSVYDDLSNYIGKNVGSGSRSSLDDGRPNYAFRTGYWDEEPAPNHKNENFPSIVAGKGYNYNIASSVIPSLDKYKDATIINTLHYLFYADNDDADTYNVTSEAIQDWFSLYTKKYGGKLILDKYSEALFEKVDDEFENRNITAKENFKLSDVIVSSDTWKKFFNFPYTPTITNTNQYNISAIQKVVDNDFNVGKSAFQKEFYVDSSDYDELKKYVENATAKNETTYLFRYKQTVYDSQEAQELHWVKPGEVFPFEGGANINCGDTNAYVAKMWVQLDFDIIDLTFTKNNVDTIIPVVSSPQDMVADGEHPKYTDDDNDPDWMKIFKIILIALAIILLLVILGATGLLPMLLKGIVWLICAPFKLIAKGVKAIKKKVDKSKGNKQNVVNVDTKPNKTDDTPKAKAKHIDDK